MKLFHLLFIPISTKIEKDGDFFDKITKFDSNKKKRKGRGRGEMEWVNELMKEISERKIYL